jgi:uncharacterized phage-like protein YoqJ
MKDMIVAATGHRLADLDDDKPDTFTRLVDYTIEVIPSYNITLGISGMAGGFDQAFAMACCELNIPWVAAVPFKGQESIWPKQTQEFYHTLLNKATEIVIVCEGGYTPWKFQKRNEYMVNRANTMLALWNGKKEGGTYNCIKYAEQVGRPVNNVWAGWESRNAA